MLTLIATTLLPLVGTPGTPQVALLSSPTAVAPVSAPAAAAGTSAMGAPPSGRLMRAVPADPVAFAALWDVDGMAERGQKSAWYRFYQDQQVQNLMSAVGDLVEKAMEENGEELPFELDAVCDAIHGSVIGFVNVEPREQSDPRVLAGLLFEPGENRAGLEELFDTIITLASEELGSIEEIYGDADLTRMEAPDGEGELVWVDHGDLLAVMISNEPEYTLTAAHGVLDRFTGKDPAEGLAGSSSLLQARSTNSGAVDFEALFDAERVIDLILTEEPVDDHTMGILENIGVTELRWLYGSFAMGTGESFDSNFSGYLPPGTLLSELKSVMGPAPVGMLELMPAGLKQVSLSSFDLHALYEIILGAVKSHDEEAYNQVNGMLQMLGAMNGVDIEKDVLAQFTGDWGSFLLPGTDTPIGDVGEMMMMGIAPGGALLVGLEDTDEFELFIDEILSTLGLDQMIETEDYNGVEIKKFDLGGPAAYVAFTDEALVYASSADPIRAAIQVSSREDAKTASSDASIRKVLKAHPSASSVSIMDTAALVEMYLVMLSEIGEVMGMAGLEDDDNPFTYLPWPDAAIAKKYFEGRIVSILEFNGDSLRTTTYSK